MTVIGGLDKTTRRCTAALLTLALLATLAGAAPRQAQAQEKEDQQPGRLRVTVVDEGGAARGGACVLVVDAAGGEQAVCDEDGDGALAADGLAAGVAAVKPIQPAGGCAGAFGAEVEIPAGGEAALTLTDACEPLQPTEQEPAEEKPAEEKPTEEQKPTEEPKETEPPADPLETPVDEPTQTPTPSPTPAPPLPPTTGTLEITLTSGTFGTPSLGACFEILDQSNYATLVTGCDGDDGATDGLTSFAGLPQSRIVVNQVSGDLNDNPAESQESSVKVGETTSLWLTTMPLADLVIDPVAEDGVTRLHGACFEVRRSYAGGASRGACAGPDGLVVFPNLPAYSWTLVETTAPAVAVSGMLELVPLVEPANVAYRQPGRPVIVPPGWFLQTYVHDSPTWVYHDVGVDKTVAATHHRQLGSLTISTVGLDYGQTVYGACFRIDGPFVGPTQRCDSDEDGQIVVTDLPVGNYTVTATGNAYTLNGLKYRASEPGPGSWSPAVRIDAGAMDQAVQIGFDWRPSFYVYSLDATTPQPVDGACFTVYEEAANGARTFVDQACVNVPGSSSPNAEVGLFVPRSGRYVVVAAGLPSRYAIPSELWITVAPTPSSGPQGLTFYFYQP